MRLPALRRGVSRFVLTLLAIELLDELVFGVREAAWPLVRDDLGLNYIQIGLLLGIPPIIGNLVEPLLGVLADNWKRRLLILGGGLVFALACLLIGLSHSFWMFMVANLLFNPASGAFVSLSQAALMDHQPDRHEQNMARWTLAGTLGIALGPFLLGGLIALGFTWQTPYLLMAACALGLVAVARRFPFPNGASEGDSLNLVAGFRKALSALRRREVLRWLVLLQFSDLMLDVLLGYMALYFVDVVGVSEAEAGLAVVVWTVVGLLGDVLLIPLLERVRGLTYLRISVVLELLLFPAFLLAPGLPLKLVLLGLHGIFNAGWYPILAGQLYSAMPGQSGAVLVVGNVAGLLGGLLPFSIGLLAQHVGLSAAMWALLLGPLVLLVGLPRHRGDG